MNCIVVFMDNGLSYDDQESKPIVVCANKQIALQYIDSHPITKQVFKDVFYYLDPNSLTHANYYTEEVEIFTGQ